VSQLKGKVRLEFREHPGMKGVPILVVVCPRTGDEFVIMPKV
jgi:hypothetical protein